MTIAVIRPHPKSAAVLLIEMPAEIARRAHEQPDCPYLHWDRPRKCWVAQAAVEEDLVRILIFAGATVVDERDRPDLRQHREPEPPRLDDEIVHENVAELRRILAARRDRISS